MNYKYGIVCAMQEEVDKIITAFNIKQKNTICDHNVYTNNDITLIQANIGKIANAFATTTLINNYNVDAIINIGLAGSLTNLKTNSAYVINSVTQHDTFIPFVKYQKDMYKTIKCTIPKQLLTYKSLTLTTGDQFITDSSRITNKADLVDMEGYAVAYVANKHNKPIILIKAISDNADAKSEYDIFKNLNMAMEQSIKILKLIIKTSA